MKKSFKSTLIYIIFIAVIIFATAALWNNVPGEKDVVYRTACVWTVCEGDNLPYSYMLQHRELAIDQIQRAGLRLAKVMNDLFK